MDAGMRFIVIDDCSTMRRMQRRALEKLGFLDVVEAEDGRQALAVMDASPPDVILTDWNMPTMDGLELVRAVRARDKQIPILMITTEAGRERVIEAIQAGVNDYLIKPFTPDTLSAKIRKIAGMN